MPIRLNLSHTALIASLVFSICLIAPAFSHAATFCVMAGQACPAGTSDIPLDAAISAAEQNPGPDKILLGDLGQPYVGPFSVNNNVASPEQIDIVAVGNTRPVLTAPGGQNLAIGLRKASMQGVDVQTPISPNAGAVGVRLDQATLKDVRVTGGSANDHPSAIRAVGQAQIEDTTVDFTQISFASSGLQVTPTGSVSAEGLTVKDAGYGLNVTDGSLFATRAHVEANVFGIDQFGGSVHLSRSVVATKAASAGALVSDDSFTVLDHVTVAEQTLHPTRVVPALRLNSFNANGQVILESVALAGFDKGIERNSGNGHTIAVQAAQSVWANGADDAGPITERPTTSTPSRRLSIARTATSARAPAPP